MNMVANDSASSLDERKDHTNLVMHEVDVHTYSFSEVMHSIQELALSVKTVTQDVEVK